MDKLFPWLKAQLGPSPVGSLGMLVMTGLAVLSAFKITPSLPSWLGNTFLIALVASASLYWAVSVVRLWPRVAGGPRAGSYRIRSRSQATEQNGDTSGIAALDELSRMTGLETVKREISTLIQRLKVETARRDQAAILNDLYRMFFWLACPLC